ncbi:MAG: Na+/H+ antiporter subunit E [Holophagae bacterium]|jgi:multicomponent Na+:H+ antiporter subunit E
MRVLSLNLMLALLWAAVVGSIDIAQLAVGFVVGYGVLWLAKPVLGPTRYFGKLFSAVGFLAFFVYELVLANLRVAWDVLTPRARRRPGVIAVPLEEASDTEITVLANLVTLTPGSLSLDVAADRTRLFVHAMFVDDPDVLKTEIKRGFERRVLELLR